MKVKELISKLCYFNPDAEVTINVDGHEFGISSISWIGTFEYNRERNIEKEQIHADGVSLSINDNNEKEIIL